MHLLPFLRWIAATPVARAIDDVKWAFPAIESIHILGMALLAGTIVAVDLRVLGMGLRSRTTAELARELQPWTWLGLAVMMATVLRNTGKSRISCIRPIRLIVSRRAGACKQAGVEPH